MTLETISDHWIDSRLELRHDRAFLEFRVRVAFELNDPETGGRSEDRYDDGHGHHMTVRYAPWPIGAFPRWRERFKTVIEENWNDKLWIVGVPAGVSAPTVRHPRGVHPIACRVHVEPVSSPEQAHCLVTVYYLAPGTTYRRSSFENPASCNRHWSRWYSGPQHGTLDNHDLEPKSCPPASFPQIPVVHEIGHYLGLSHVACRGDEGACYGAPGSYEAGDIMGRGMRWDDWHAGPWLRRLQRYPSAQRHAHLAGVRWMGTTRRPT